MNNQIATLKTFSEHIDPSPFGWLEGRSYSEKYVICLGAGPWKIKRRKNVQAHALRRLNGRDISEVHANEKWYPFEWQNTFLKNLSSYLRSKKLSMDNFCNLLTSMDSNEARQTLYMAATLSKKGTKVLSLFCRDALKIDSFPIDRHVRRLLDKYELPTNEDEIIMLCQSAQISPREIAVGFVRAASDMENPDWSI